MRRNHLTSVLAYHPFHHVLREPVDEIFLSFLIQPKDNTAIQNLQYASDILTKRCDTVTCSFVFNVDFVVDAFRFAFIVKHGGSTGELSRLRTIFTIMSVD